MRDVIKTERARKIINFMTGKIVKITEEDGCREKICTGIYGVGEVVSMKQVCLSFTADFRKDDSGAAGAQLGYEEWETLINTGKWSDPDFMTIELV